MLPTASIAVSFGPFTFDRTSRLLRRGGQELPLPPRVLAVLELLLTRAGEIVPRQEIIDSVWKEAFVTDTSLAEAISVLRQSLGDDPQTPTYIQTVHRRGYRFVAPLVEGSPPGLRAGPSNADGRAGEEKASPSIAKELVPWSVAILCAILAAAALWQYTRLRSPLPPVVRMRIAPAAGTAFDGRAPSLAVSPDGRVLAWSACDTACRLYVRRLDELEGRAVAGSEDASAPFFSPDGQWIGFFAAGKLRKVALAGGLPIALTDATQPFGAVWMADGRIVFGASARGGLMRVSDRGGKAEPLTLPSAGAGEIHHAWPALAPGGRALLFTIATSPLEGAPGRIAVMPLDVGQTAWHTVVESADLVRTASPGHVAFSRGNELHAAAFDRVRLTIAGPDPVVLSGAARAQFAISGTGSIAYAASPDIVAPSLEWAGSAASASAPRELAALHAPALSPDGGRIAGVGRDQSGADVWIGDVVRGATTRLTHGGINVAPVWSADGGSVFYASSRQGPFEVWSRDASGGAPEKQVLSATTRQRHLFPSSVSRDGRLIACTETGGPSRGDIVVTPIAGGSPIATINTAFDETNGLLSPDGRLLAYQSDESGRWEIYLLRIADQQRTPVSTAGGTSPIWSLEGRTLFYQAGGRLVSVGIDGVSGTIGAQVDVLGLEDGAVTGIAPDGRILLRRHGEAASREAVLTLEWVRELRRILGPPETALPR
jgi:eukaryotic-like serine/threonine-protein kinase